jgi:hypothetical protein
LPSGGWKTQQTGPYQDALGINTNKREKAIVKGLTDMKYKVTSSQQWVEVRWLVADSAKGTIMATIAFKLDVTAERNGQTGTTTYTLARIIRLYDDEFFVDARSKYKARKVAEPAPLPDITDRSWGNK